MSFTVYKASAGSGKTYMLVKEYLKLVLRNPNDFRQTLAITFTNKAAAEMKSRILEALNNMVRMESLTAAGQKKTKELTELICKEAAIDKETALKNAGRALELILHNYSDFAVSTIDSFVTNIVRSFAKDLLLPVNFEIELESQKLISQAVDYLISKVGHNKPLTEILVTFIESKADAHKGINIESELHDIGNYLFKEDSSIYLEKLSKLTMEDFTAITQQLTAAIKKHEARLQKIAQEACELIESHNISPKAFYYKDKGLYTYFRKLAELKVDSIHNKNVAKGIESDKWTSNEADAHEADAILRIKDKLLTYYQEVQSFAEEELKNLELFRLMFKNVFPLSVLLEIYNIVEEIKAENNILHISEFNKKIAKIILSEPVPFIYERIGTRYKNYMIDEFQDTSALQWFNLLPLIENALSVSGFTMLVGDGKQAIYRWRDGEVEQFVRLPEVYTTNKTIFQQQTEDLLKHHYTGKTLTNNFRSNEEIINFNNSFFNYAKGLLTNELSPIYDDVAQQPRQENTGGYVSIKFIEREQYFEECLSETKRIIEELTQDEGFDPAAIAVLCRTNKNANDIARFLMSNKINVVSNESLLLQNAPLIGFLIACLEYLNKTDNTIAKIHISNYLIAKNKISDVELHHFLYQVATDSLFFENNISKYFPSFQTYSLQKLPLYELCEELIRLFDLGKKPNPFLQFFLDAVLSFSGKHQSNLSAFLSWWEEHKGRLSVTIPEGENAVRVMSIHKAKGLQFPVVIYPFAKEAQVKPTKKNMWIDIENQWFPGLDTYLLPVVKELEKTPYKELYESEINKTRLDLLNLLYVSFTRPEKQLYIITEKPGKTSKSFNTHNILKGYLLKEGLWQEDTNTYTFGKPEAAEAKAPVASDTDILFDTFISNAWQQKLVMLQQAETKWDVKSPDKRFRHGNIIHTCMALIGSYKDVDNAVGQLITEGLIAQEEAVPLKNKIDKIVNHPELRHFYEPDLYYRNESELMNSSGQISRPDRIVFLKDSTIIIDYKTGLPSAAHKTQVKEYAQLLAECGYSKISTFLVYADIDKIEKEQLY